MADTAERRLPEFTTATQAEKFKEQEKSVTVLRRCRQAAVRPSGRQEVIYPKASQSQATKVNNAGPMRSTMVHVLTCATQRCFCFGACFSNWPSMVTGEDLRRHCVFERSVPPHPFLRRPEQRLFDLLYFMILM